MKPTFFALFFFFTAFLLLNNSASVFSAPVTTVTTPPPSASPKANLTLEELIRQLYPSIDHLPENPCTPNMTAADCQKLKNILGNLYTPFTPLIGTR